jgi:hypothetical protein
MSLLRLHKGSELLQALLQSHYREDQAVIPCIGSSTRT